jgi:hypothetical protein
VKEHGFHAILALLLLLQVLRVWWCFCNTGVFDRNGRYLDVVHIPYYYIRNRKVTRKLPSFPSPLFPSLTHTQIALAFIRTSGSGRVEIWAPSLLWVAIAPLFVISPTAPN